MPERTTSPAKETAETKGELSREDAHDILQGMQDLHEDGLHTAERKATHTLRAHCKCLRSLVGDLAKIKGKERGAEHRG